MGQNANVTIGRKQSGQKHNKGLNDSLSPYSKEEKAAVMASSQFFFGRKTKKPPD
ncbi:hypothetical protein ACED98_10850 [Streptococcus thoraltensis]